MFKLLRNTIIPSTFFCIPHDGTADRNAPLPATQPIELSAGVYAGDVCTLIYIAENRLF